MCLSTLLRSGGRAALIALLAVTAGASCAATRAVADAPQPTPGRDVTALRTILQDNHPDPAFSFDRDGLERRLKTLGEARDVPTDRAAAWWRLATLNPLFADAHVLVGFPDWRGDAEAHLAAGGGFFPFEVVVGTDASLRIAALPGGGQTPWAGRRILAINGRDAGEVVQPLLDRMHGDTPAFRAGLLSQRWWLYYWKAFGAPAAFTLALDELAPRTLTLSASVALPSVLADEADFERRYRLEWLPGDVALMTVASFDAETSEAFEAFTDRAFTRMRERGTRTLVIDIRRNGGGDDALWIHGLMPYLADRPYRTGSSYRKRIVARFADAGETVGEVVDGRILQDTDPGPRRANHFEGERVVLVGTGTYSSAIVFANVIQDHGFGRLAGAPGVARSRQSGGVQAFSLPDSGLVVTVPRFILDRPSGGDSSALVTPDIPLVDDPLEPARAVEELLRVIGPPGRVPASKDFTPL